MSLSTLQKPQTQTPHLTPNEVSGSNEEAHSANLPSNTKQSFKTRHPIPSPYPLPISPMQKGVESNPSMMSSSKLTAEYVAQWDNPADREKALARFKSFDITGNIVRGGSLLDQQSSSPGAVDSQDNLQKVNVVTKLPLLNQDNQSVDQLHQQDLTPSLAFGPEYFTMEKPKDFIMKNVSLAPTFAAHRSSGRDISEPKEIQGSMQKNLSQASLDSKLLVSNLSIKQQIQLLDKERQHQKSSTINISQSNTSVQNPAQSPQRYKTEKEKYMEQCKKGVEIARELGTYNVYNMRNYRADNKKLTVELPGEKMAGFFELPPEKREEVDKKQLKKYMDQIHKDKVKLQEALKMSYDKAVARQQRLQQQGETTGTMKASKQAAISKQSIKLNNQASSTINCTDSTVLQTNAGPSLKTIGNSPELSNGHLVPSGLNHAISQEHYVSKASWKESKVQDILKHAQSEAFELAQPPITILKGGVLSVSENPIEIDKDIANVGYNTSRSRQTVERFEQSHLPQIVNAFLGKKHIKARPRRLQSLQPRAPSERKALDSSLTNKKLRQFSLHNNATKLINQTRHLANTSDNQNLQTIAGELHKNMVASSSVTCLTDNTQHTDILKRFSEFMKHDRNNAFRVEDFYLLKNNLPNTNKKDPRESMMSQVGALKHKINVDLPTPGSMQKSMREFAADNDVIHVTIDKQSLQQLTKLSDNDIKQDQNVKLVTSRKDQFTESLGNGLYNASTRKGFANQPNALDTGSSHFRIVDGTVESKKFNPDLSYTPQKQIYEGEQIVTIPQTSKEVVNAMNSSHSNSYQNQLSPKSSSGFQSINAAEKQFSKTLHASPSQSDGIEQAMQITNLSPKQKSLKAKKIQQNNQSKITSEQSQDGKLKTSPQLEINVQQTKSQYGKTQALLELKSPRTESSPKEPDSAVNQTGRASPTKQSIFSKLSPNKKIDLNISLGNGGGEQPQTANLKEQGENSPIRYRQSDALQAETNVVGSQKTGFSNSQHMSIKGSQTDLPQKSANEEVKNTEAPQQKPNDLRVNIVEQTESLPYLVEENQNQGQIQENEKLDQSRILSASAKRELEIEEVNQQHFNVTSSPPIQLQSYQSHMHSNHSRANIQIDETGKAFISTMKTSGKMHSNSESPKNNMLNVPSTMIIGNQRIQHESQTLESVQEFQQVKEIDVVNQSIDEMALHQSVTMESEKTGIDRWSEGHKRQVKEMQILRNAQLTPGAALDVKLDLDILELDRLFREVNFGIPINHETFDQHLPKTIDKVKDLTEYRQWKQRQIIFKRQQLLERQIKFQKRLDRFKDVRDQRKEFEKLCKYGYEKERKDQDYLSYIASQGSGLLFLDGTNKSSGSMIISRGESASLRLFKSFRHSFYIFLGKIVDINEENRMPRKGHLSSQGLCQDIETWTRRRTEGEATARQD